MEARAVQPLNDWILSNSYLRALYLETGSISAVSRITGLARSTVRAHFDSPHVRFAESSVANMKAGFSALDAETRERVNLMTGGLLGRDEGHEEGFFNYLRGSQDRVERMIEEARQFVEDFHITSDQWGAEGRYPSDAAF